MISDSLQPQERNDIPIGIVDLLFGTQKLLLACVLGKMATDLVAVFLSLQQRKKVEAGPHLLASELTTPISN